MAGIGKAIKGLGLLAKKYKKAVTKKASSQMGKKWKNPITEHPKGSKADLIERIRNLPPEIGGKGIKDFGKGKKKRYIKRDPDEGVPSQSSDWPYWRGEE